MHTPETANAEALLGFNRALWSCECVHRILYDAATWNDKCRVRSGNGPESQSCLRRLAISLVLRPGNPVASTTRELNRNTQPCAKSAA